MGDLEMAGLMKSDTISFKNVSIRPSNETVFSSNPPVYADWRKIAGGKVS
jgi:hypothetical protein